MNTLSRRRLLQSASATTLLTAFGGMAPAWALAATPTAGREGVVKGSDVGNGPVVHNLAVRAQALDIAGKVAPALTINGSIPGPLIELVEGRDAHLNVSNHLAVDSSIHWHGLILPFEMDGVPGVTFQGIPSQTTFNYQFPVIQSGTYWYHSHSGLQEQSGVYGPMVIHPAKPDPVASERDYVVLLSDWTFEDPHDVFANLKKMSDYYNYQQRTGADLITEAHEKGLSSAVRNRLAWDRMRMMATDIADVTGSTYSYLMNGMHAAGNWTGLFKPGERVRLRFINGSAMSYFNVRVPGLTMTVVAADGQNVQPVDVEEFQIGIAETLDVVVTASEDRAYTVMAEAMDRSGFTAGTLAPRLGMRAAIPALRERPLRTMVDMGMDMDEMRMHAMDMPGMGRGVMKKMDHSTMKKMDHSSMAKDAEHPMMPTEGTKTMAVQHNGKDMSGMANGAMNNSTAGPIVARHNADTHGAGNVAVATVQRNRLGEPGAGLGNVGHRVLTYNDLRRLDDDFDKREPTRELELHLTGNMERYMFSFDGKQFHQVNGPLEFKHNERLRLVLVNDTMMEHPIHTHGMWMELENGQGQHLPRKHTISIKPAERIAVRITPTHIGRWAFHCHLLYHMHAGMFRVIRVG